MIVQEAFFDNILHCTGFILDNEFLICIWNIFHNNIKCDILFSSSLCALFILST